MVACILLIAGELAAQTQDVLGAHDLSSGVNNVRGSMSAACLYCHAPHSGIGKGPLWGQTLSTQTYTLYSSDTMQNSAGQPVLGRTSSLCLSCHDGTVAPGLMVPYGQLNITGKMSNLSIFGTHLENSHPFSLQLPMKDAANLIEGFASSGTISDPTNSVKLINGNIECSTCHNPHVQNTDKRSANFLVRDNVGGALCLSCHTTQPRTVSSKNNTLVGWASSIHATSGVQVNPAAGLGGYSTVAEFACQSCHASHNAGGSAGLLRNPTPAVANVDTTSQSCIACHAGGNNLSVPAADVFSEFKKKGHPFAEGTNVHTASEKVQLDQNRHATCADCHNGHASQQVTNFGPAPAIRVSQNGVTGIGSDGSTLTGNAGNQFENCLRCHGNSTGKQSLALYGYLPNRASFGSDALNLILQFGTTATSAHPVMRIATGVAQPSLLSNMWDITGKIQSRPMGSQIFCTDCHNSDDNREFGGNGPNGPHGSNNDHILERPYLASQVAPGTFPTGGPGSPITNLQPNPPTDPGVPGPYTLCAKCHNLTNILSDASFNAHQKHVAGVGISCSVCHTAHGVPAGSPVPLTGKRLVNFDVNVVAPNNGVISYDGTTCSLVCHKVTHNPDGSIVKIP
jgi:predicted CXXCH cytochrome family protein